VTDPAAFPIWLSLRIALLAMLLVTPLGIALAWLQARKRYPLRPVVGYFLVVVFGRRGVVGAWLESNFDMRIIFTPTAAVIAAAVVALPILVKTAQPAIESVPQPLLTVARSLGLPPVAVFFRVVLRHAWRGVTMGLVLAFVRAMGEFGATLMFAGNIPGQTNTMPIEIFAAYQAGDDARAQLYVVVLTVLSTLTVLLAAKFAPQKELS
jgi:molybdate transport system permease protein